MPTKGARTNGILNSSIRNRNDIEKHFQIHVEDFDLDFAILEDIDVIPTILISMSTQTR